MKNILFILIVLMTTACKNIKNKEVSVEYSEENNIEMTNSEMNTLVDDPEEEGAKMLLGKIDYNGLQNEVFTDWFTSNSEAHILDTENAKKLKPLLNDVSIKVFMGTWCEDSQREVPGLLKVLNVVDFDMERFEMIATSHDKETPTGLEKGYTIEYVPTIIFSKKGVEIGRIVEYTHDSLEKDMYAILSGADYKHAYAE